MGWLSRAIATQKREAAWEVDDSVPDDRWTDGCDYCDRGWAHGPGFLYQCNDTEGPSIYNFND